MVLPIRVPNNVLLNFIWWHSSNYDRRWMIYASCYHHEHYEDYDDENSVLLVLNTWCIPCYMQVLLMSEVPSSYFHLIQLHGFGAVCPWCAHDDDDVRKALSTFFLSESYRNSTVLNTWCIPCYVEVILSLTFLFHTFIKQMSQVAMAGSTHTITSTFHTSLP